MTPPAFLRRAAQQRVRRQIAQRVDATIHPTATIGAVVLRTSGARGRLVIGPRVRIEEDVIIRITDGGSIYLGPDCHVRTGAVLNVSGQLRFEGRNSSLSFYSVVHCAESVLFEAMAGAAEGVTVVDSVHFHGPRDAPEEHYYANNRSEPVVIGRNTWLAAKCTISPGVTLGERCIVGSNSLVARGNHAPESTLIGVPARVVPVAR